MKKNLIFGLTVLAVVGGVLTGCGNKEVTKTDETQAVITESTQAALEKDLEPATEKTTEATTKAVKADFLAENGLKITPNGSMTIPLAIQNTDDTADASATTSVTTVASSEEGYSDTTFTAELTSHSNVSYYITAFDRYTGVDLEGNLVDFGASNGSTHNEVAVIDVDGTQYDCSLSMSQSVVSNNTLILTAIVHHPSNYDGVVFQLGKCTKTIRGIAESIDYSKAFKITDYAGLLDGQYFFTATDK